MGPDNNSPQITVYNDGSGDFVPPDNTPETAKWFVGYSSVVVSLADTGSGLSAMNLYDIHGEPLTWQFYDAAPSANAEIYLPEDRDGYRLNVTDKAGNQSNLYFNLDRHEPEVKFTETRVKTLGDYYSVDLDVNVTDNFAGIGAGPKLLQRPPLYGDLGVHTETTYPRGPLLSTFTYTDLQDLGAQDYAVVAADKADNLGVKQLWLSNISQPAVINESGPWYVETLNNGLPFPDNILVHKGLVHLPGAESGLNLRSGTLTVDYPKPPGCYIAGDPSGMSVKVTAGQYTPDVLEDLSSYSAYVPVKLTYDVANLRSFEATGRGTYQFGGWRLPQYTYIKIDKGANLNEMSMSCGTEVYPIPPGTLKYEATVSLDTAWTFIGSPKIVKQEWVTPDLNVQVKSDILEVELYKVVNPGKVTISRVPYDLKVPGYRLGHRYIYDIDVPLSVYEGNVRVTFYVNTTGLTGRQKDGILIYHNDGTGWHNDTTELAADHVSYIGRSLSPFAMLVPIDDTLPPQTELHLIGHSYEQDGRTYVSSRTMVELEAFDTALDPADITGPATTYYLIDADPTPECFAAPYDAGAAPGSCANPVYTGPFTLREGVRAVTYLSVDKSGNYGAPQTRTFYVDGSAPRTTLTAGGALVADGGSAYVSDSSSVTLAAADPVSNGVASLLAGVYCLIDVTPEACGPMANVDPAAPAGSCANPVYGGTFTLAAGTHTVYYTSMDNAGNREALRTALFTVVGSTGYAAFAVSPSSGPIGQAFSVSGSGFGTYSAAASRLLINGATVQVSSWANTRITAKVPGHLTPGTYELAAGRLVSGSWNYTNTLGFTVTAPALASVSLSSGPIGQAVTISGSGFGQYGGTAVSRVLLGTTTAQVLSWIDARIMFRVPGSLPPGAQELSVERLYEGFSSRGQAGAFTVTAPSVAQVLPSSGPIGQPFVINGAGFGAYISTMATRVLLGGATVQVTSWTDARIALKVPGALGSGDYELVIERQWEGGVARGTGGNFKVVGPGLAPLTPSSGPIGQVIYIDGSGFGKYISTSATRVLLGGEPAPISGWTDSRITARAPGALAPGAYALTVERYYDGGVVRESTSPFTVTAPAIAQVTPSSGPIGQPVVLDGSGFGQYISTMATRVFIGGAMAQVTSWTDGRLAVRVPGVLTPGDYAVTVERLFGGGEARASAGPFTVVLPGVSSVNLSSGPIGQPVTINGSGFGQYGGAAVSRVLLGDTTAQVTSWGDARITAKVPGALPPGDYALVVGRYCDGAEALAQAGTFSVTEPAITELSLSSGPIGQPIVINGSGFGQFGGAAVSRVLLGGTTAQVASWTDARIIARVPGALVPGEYSLTVERLSDGARASDSAGSFLVTAPAVAAVNLSSGPIGQPVTILGSGFGQYGGAAVSRVLLGDTTAQVAAWQDARIIVHVPGTLAAGEYALGVERVFEGVTARSAAGSFTVNVPAIAAVEPSSGPIGQPVAISGAGFGQYGGTAVSRVLLGGTTAQITSWTDARITARVPGTLAAGEYALAVERVYGGSTVTANGGPFMVISPVASGVLPSSGPVASAFSVAGAGFGRYISSATTRVLIGGVPAPLTYWSDTTIRGRLPYLAAGLYPVVVERAFGTTVLTASAGGMQLVEPALASLSPASGAAGSLLTLYGAGFGTYYSGKVNGEPATRVKLGGLNCLISSWSDTRIRVLVPSSLASGSYAVRVERASAYGEGCGNGCVVASGELSFEVPGGAGVSAARPLAAASAAAPAAEEREAALPVSARWGGYVAAAGGAAVSIPENALPGLQSDTLPDDPGLLLPDEVDEEYLLPAGAGLIADEPAAAETLITISGDNSGPDEQAAREAAMAKAGLSAAGPVSVFGPEGLRFNAPAALTLPCGAAQGAGKLGVYVWEPVAARWSELPLISSSTAGGGCVVSGLAEHFSVYQAMLKAPAFIPPAGFSLGDVYVYPNPAKGGKVPVFHIEVPQADKVTVRVYTAAGRLAHERVLTGAPALIDDGNGAAYAYEYAWTGHIPSGVYHYAVIAEKSGWKLRANGRFAVVR